MWEKGRAGRGVVVSPDQMEAVTRRKREVANRRYASRMLDDERTRQRGRLSVADACRLAHR